MSLVDKIGGPPEFPRAKATTCRCLNKVDYDKFQAAVTDYLTSPTTRECLTDDIKNLTEIVMSMETCFANISHQIIRIDNKKLLLGQEGCVIELAPHWKALHDEYTSLMMESQLTASKTNSKIDDLLEVILPILKSDRTLNNKQKSLNKYITSLETFQAEGRKNAARFSRLRYDVDSFRNHIKEIATDRGEDVRRRIKELDKKIAELQTDLEKSSKFFAACWDILTFSAQGVIASAGATVTALANTGFAGLRSLSGIAPAVGIGILTIGFICLGFSILKGVKQRGEERQAKTKELTALQDEHEAAEYETHQLKDVLNQMHALETDFDQVVSRLSSIQDVWNMLVVDAQRLSYFLFSLKTEDDAQEFELTSRAMTVTYQVLRLALEQYSLAVAK